MKVLMSTEDRRTEVCAWQPASFGSCSRAFCAWGSVAALVERAMSTSSVWSLGFLLPRYSVFNFWIGSMDSGEITW